MPHGFFRSGSTVTAGTKPSDTRLVTEKVFALAGPPQAPKARRAAAAQAETELWRSRLMAISPTCSRSARPVGRSPPTTGPRAQRLDDENPGPSPGAQD